MKKLDRSKPFGSVRGEADYRFIQDGVKFDSQGNEIKKKKAPAENVAIGADTATDTTTGDVNPPVGKKPNYTTMKNADLQAALEEHDIPWTDRKEAIAWLNANG